MKISQMIAAPPPALYRAFLDPDALVRWMPPAGMSAQLLRFEPWAGGGYRMRLSYDRSSGGRGKTEPDADVADVRFVELTPPHRIVQAVDFQTDEAAYGGTMTMTWTFADDPAGSRVAVEVENAPPGISEADHEAGIRSSLSNLAAFLSAGEGHHQEG